MEVSFFNLTETLGSARNYVRNIDRKRAVTPRLVGLMVLGATQSALCQATNKMFAVDVVEEGPSSPLPVLNAYVNKHGTGEPYFTMTVAYADNPDGAPEPGGLGPHPTVGLFVSAPHTEGKPVRIATIEEGAIGLKGYERLNLWRHLNRSMARAGL